MAIRLGRSVSRNNSNASRQLNGVSENAAAEKEASGSTEKTANNGGTSSSNNKNTNTKTLTKNKSNFDNGRRTVITLMGGRGYVNYRQPCCAADKSKSAMISKDTNSIDAHIVIWELKL